MNRKKKKEKEKWSIEHEPDWKEFDVIAVGSTTYQWFIAAHTKPMFFDGSTDIYSFWREAYPLNVVSCIQLQYQMQTKYIRWLITRVLNKHRKCWKIGEYSIKYTHKHYSVDMM